LKAEEEKVLIDALVSSRYGYAQFRERIDFDIKKRTLQGFS
jgi:hypothetical protein